MPDAAPLMMELTTSAAVALKFRSMSAHEEVSRLFEFQVIALSDDSTVSADELLGTPAAVSLQVSDDTKRWFHGVVASFGIEGVDGRSLSYRLTLRPWLWLLTRSADIRIFQDKSVPDIVKEIFQSYNGSVVDSLTGTYSARTYCVQYRETDFNFVSRLLEEEGIFYFFQHSQDKHDLVLADDASAHQPFSGFATINYTEDERNLAEQPAISRWHMRHEIQTGKVTLRDFNFTTPSTDLTSTPATTSRSHAEAAHEVYDYPGLYAEKSAGDALATVRMEEAASRFRRHSGQGNTPGLLAGGKFTLGDHPRADQNADYIVLSTQIDMQQAGYEAGDDTQTQFLCRFTAQSYAEPFRPARITRKPAVAGPQTAIVVGDGDEGDITTDEYARVKVQFPWDRLGSNNSDSSCWVRVATPWAGNGWGMMSLPRLGQEVVVDFLEGDPDQPIITGRVYNALQKTPYDLPDHATVSTIKSRSKQGGADDYNELRFEDDPGSEYLLLHAQKDRLEFVEDTLKSDIGGDEHRSVTGDRKEKVEGDHHLGVDGEFKHQVGGKYGLGVGDDIMIKGGGIYSLKTDKDFTAQSGAAISFKSTGDLHMKIGGNIGAEAAQNVYIKGDTNVVIEAGTQLSLVVGGSSVVLSSAGVSITGTLVNINSGGSPGSGTAPSPVAPTDPDPPDDPDAPEDPLSHR